MKLILFFLYILTFSQLYAIDVYIVAGQSNGWNISKLRADPKSDQPDQFKVYYYGMKCVSEPSSSSFKLLKNLDKNYGGYGLANALREHAQDDIVFIQYCRCGAPIHKTDARMSWYPGDDPQNGQIFNEGLYNLFTVYLEHAKEELKNKYNKNWNFKGLFWHQGESESNSAKTIEKYPQNLKNLITRFRMDLGPQLKIVAAHIRELKENDRQINRILDQVSKADPNFAVVQSNDLTFRSEKDVHFNEKGAINLGKRMAKAMVK